MESPKSGRTRLWRSSVSACFGWCAHALHQGFCLVTHGVHHEPIGGRLLFRPDKYISSACSVEARVVVVPRLVAVADRPATRANQLMTRLVAISGINRPLGGRGVRDRGCRSELIHP